MTQVSKLIIAGLVILLAAVAVLGQFTHVRQQVSSYTNYTSNAGQLTAGTLVGQTFVAEDNNLSAIGVMFATYSNRANTGTVLFHLRSWSNLNVDLRSASVPAASLGDNQLHVFTFDAIAASQGQTYFFYVESPNAQDGKAVTVDISSQDPYFRGAAYIVRNAVATPISLELLNAWGRPTADVAFETYHTVLLRQAVTRTVTGSIRTFIATWPTQKTHYLVYIRAALQAAIMLLAAYFLTRERYNFFRGRFGKKRLTYVILTAALIAGLAFRIVYAVSLPVTNDEGNYLYDARTWLEGYWAGGDGYVKAPLFIAWVTVWQLLAGHSVLASRLSSVVIGALTMYPLYFLARELWGRRAGLLTAIMWAVAGSAIVFDVYVHTQPLALFFGVAGLAVILMALHGTTPQLAFFSSNQKTSDTKWFMLAGILLGLGVGSRKSVLALGLLPILFVVLQGKTWKLKIKHLVAIGIGFILVMLAFTFFAWWFYGPVGVQEALGLNSAEDGINVVADDPEQVRAYSLHGMTPFFRESLPLIFLSVIGLGVALEKTIRCLLRFMKKQPPKLRAFLYDFVVPKLGWLPAWWVLLWAWGFFHEYEGQAFMFWGIPALWYGFVLVVLWLTIWPRPVEEKLLWESPIASLMRTTQPGFLHEAGRAAVPRYQIASPENVSRLLLAALTVPIWVYSFVFFYEHWIKFHANYISEFIPPIILLSGYGIAMLFTLLKPNMFLGRDYPVLELMRRLGVALVGLMVFWAFFVTNYITYVFEHTGTFDQTAVRQAATWATQNIPRNEPIFTGAALIPYVSGHHVSLNIAHPRWYAYEFTRKDPKRLNTFLPSAQDMVRSFGTANWVLLDDQTEFSFLNEYDTIAVDLKTKFVPVKEIDNGSNPLTFYQRVRP